jgi:hypothetical protein
VYVVYPGSYGTTAQPESNAKGSRAATKRFIEVPIQDFMKHYIKDLLRMLFCYFFLHLARNMRPEQDKYAPCLACIR